MNRTCSLAVFAVAASCGLAHADIIDLAVTRGTFDRFNPQLFDQIQFTFDDSKGSAAVPLSSLASSFGVLTGYEGTIRSLDFGYSSVAYIGFTAANMFMLYEPCGPFLPSPSSQCYVLAVTPVNALDTSIDPRDPNALGRYLDTYLTGLSSVLNSGLGLRTLIRQTTTSQLGIWKNRPRGILTFRLFPSLIRIGWS